MVPSRNQQGEQKKNVENKKKKNWPGVEVLQQAGGPQLGAAGGRPEWACWAWADTGRVRRVGEEWSRKGSFRENPGRGPSL